jgi:hypothetical protein
LKHPGIHHSPAKALAALRRHRGHKSRAARSSAARAEAVTLPWRWTSPLLLLPLPLFRLLSLPLLSSSYDGLTHNPLLIGLTPTQGNREKTSGEAGGNISDVPGAEVCGASSAEHWSGRHVPHVGGSGFLSKGGWAGEDISLTSERPESLDTVKGTTKTSPDP